MTTTNKKLTPIQFMFLIIQSQIGVAILYLPFDVFLIAKGDGWISILIAGILVQVSIFIIWLLLKQFPSKNYLDVLHLSVGSYLGKFFILIYSAYFIYLSSILLMLYYNIISTWILFSTPKWIIIGMVILASIYLVSDGVQAMSRFYLMVSSFFIIQIIFLCISYSNANLYYILPIGQEGLKTIFLGSKEATIALLGYEIIFFILPLSDQPQKKRLLYITLAHTFVTIFYVFLAFTSYIFFHPVEITLVPEPVLYLIKSYEFSIMSRIDLIFMSIWIIFATTTCMSYFYISSKGLHHLFRKVPAKRWLYIISFISFAIAWLPSSKYEISQWGKPILYLTIFLYFIIPLLLLLNSYRQKRRTR